MNWIKILIINLFVFILLLLFLEISMRVAWTSYSCLFKNCDLSRIYKFTIYEDFIEKNIGISKYSSDLGYIPNPGFIGNIEASGWENKYVSINDKGFRDNGHVFKKGELDTKRKILAVGDSFTFGDQVNDQETWPACVEKETKRATLNGGVFGYSVAQAVKRASITVKNETIDTLILSIFINNGFHRDQLKFRSGFPRPAVISINGKQLFAVVPSIKNIGTKWYPKEKNTLLMYIKNNFMIGFRIIKSLKIETSGMMRSEKHPQAATLDEIVNFALNELEKINVSNKFIVLQYSINDMLEISNEVHNLKKKIINFSKQNNIHIIDTYSVLKNNFLNQEEVIWQGHHTAYGNKLVCNEIIKNITN